MPLSDQEWAEVSTELPQPTDAVIHQYLASRQALKDEEKKERADHSFRQSLTPIARRACDIVAHIRDHERRTVWTPALEERLARDRPMYPGMMFSLAKETMESTLLWKIVRRMPKGALLHAHLNAMVDVDYLLDLTLSTPGMHISSSAPLTSPSALTNASLSIRFRNPLASVPSLYEESYVSNSYVPLTHAADTFPSGGRAGFVAWFKSRCVLSSTDAAEQHHGQDAIWKKFRSCFQVLGTLIPYEPIWRGFLRRLMSLLVADGVYWAEIRFTWPMNYCRDGQETPETDYNHMFQVIDEEVAAFQASEQGKRFWGLRMIWTAVRSLDTRSIVENMDHCLATKLAWPQLVAGYDLVGPEDDGRPLVDLLAELFWFRKQCALEGVTIPFFFHAGETLGDGDSTDDNLFDALLLGTRRLGHAFSLYKHPRLIQAVRDKRILVESCPISNEILRLTGSILQHPLPALLARGVACALCNDDPAILGQDTAGMTHDFWQALQGWENLGLAGLGSLAENSVRWAAFEDQSNDEWIGDIRAATMGSGVKAQRLKEWAVEWERFCLEIVEEYGEQWA
ncbi:adenosine deaminase-related growth factor [Echria macrotheca]|uniref:adenosine deaminase n=1 Tax=Echria macrotheca TaxID=438768 RepID=A0AAJ0B1I4_9PEZI|nr:adenosine deaminase-related growth factor [Echria macrotheca]